MVLFLSLYGCFGGLERSAPEPDALSAAPAPALDTGAPAAAAPARRAAKPAPRRRPRPSPAPAGEPMPEMEPSLDASYARGSKKGRAMRPQPARPLKAGMTDDNKDFEGYVDFLAAWGDRPDTAGQYRWLEVRGRQMVSVVDGQGHPVPNAEVQIGSWTGTTYGDGRLPYYPQQFGHADAVVVNGVQAALTDDLTVQLQDTVPQPGAVPLDVLLVIDTTGSMSDEIDRVKRTLLDVNQQVQQLQRPVELRFGAVLYKDVGDDYVTKTIPFTSDVGSFDRAIAGIRASGGGNYPEAINEALSVGVDDMQWRDDAARMGFLIADAPPNMARGGQTYADAAQKALGKGIRFHTVAASGLNDTGSLVFRQVAQLTRGQFIFIEYGDNPSRSAADHGVKAQNVRNTNNLDAILLGRIQAEIEGFGRASKTVASR